MQVYLPESVGKRSRSFRYQREELICGSTRRFFMILPSFNHLYLSGGAPIARHFSRMENDAGHSLNDLFSKFGSLNIGAPAKVQKQKQKQNNKARTYH